jgi:hypothetical protein
MDLANWTLDTHRKKVVKDNLSENLLEDLIVSKKNLDLTKNLVTSS